MFYLLKECDDATNVLNCFISCMIQEYSSSGAMPLLYSAVVACSMYLLTTCISSQWNELSYILLAHPKVYHYTPIVFDFHFKLIIACPDMSALVFFHYLYKK